MMYNYEENPQGIASIKSEKMDYNLIRIIEIIDKKIKKNNRVKIFEPGCGGGRNLDFLKRKYGDHIQIYGSDISETSISHAKANIPGHFIIARTIDDYFVGKFDLIIMLDILEHLSSVDEVEKTISLAKEKINEDGVLFISCPIELNRWSICWIFKKLNFWKDITLKYYGHTIQFTESDILDIVKKYFIIKKVSYNVHFFTQVGVVLFFYIPKQVLSLLGGDNVVSLFRESSGEIYSTNKLTHKRLKQNFIKFAIKIFSFPGRLLYFLGFHESRLRGNSKIGAMVLNIEC